jgi:RNA-directed DNA polymerase
MALKHAIEPIFEHQFSKSSYGFRPQRGCTEALNKVNALIAEGYQHVVDADIKRYFDTIDHRTLMEKVREKISDSRVLELVSVFLTQGVIAGMREWIPEEGTPQGGVISPLLANIYLDELDKEMEKFGHAMVRYADDFVVMCADATEATRALKEIYDCMRRLELELHPTKTKIVDMNGKGNSFEFLGYHFERTRRSGNIRLWARAKSEQKLRGAVRMKTKRCNGHSLRGIIEAINQTVKGWYEYFKGCIRSVFTELDGWIRMRLRSILRKRRGGRGRGRGADHQRWGNAFFCEHGLFSMVTAYDAYVSPQTR